MTSMRCSSCVSAAVSCETSATCFFTFSRAGAGGMAGSSFARRQIRPCVRKSSCICASSSLAKRSRGTRTSVPRRKKPAPDSSFCPNSSMISENGISTGNPSMSPSFSPLILILPSLISVPHLLPTFCGTRSSRKAASMILRPIGTADSEPKPPCSTMTATTIFGFT